MKSTLCAHTWISHASNELLACKRKKNANTPHHISEKLNNIHSHYEENFFSSSGINTCEEARREATLIFCHCLNIEKIQLHLKKDFIVTVIQQTQLQDYVARRAQGEPLAYIFGRKEFFGIDFMVNKHTLIPRPETEFLVEESLKYGDDKPLNILDLGCGSGCIALSILKNRSTWQAFLVDISQETLKIARENTLNLKLEDRASFILGDFSCENFCKNLCENFKNEFERATNNNIGNEIKFDIIISNPPYIPMEEYQKLHTSVKDYEPKVALVSSDSESGSKSDSESGSKSDSEIFTGSGLFHAQAVIHLAEKLLKPNGLLLIEHGYNQAQDCRNLCDTQKWQTISTEKDYSSIERYLKAFRKE